jgi:hypothetical protein
MTLNTQPLQRVYPGDDVGYIWCSNHEGKGKQTRHRWDGHRLICLECEPEEDEKKDEEE